MPHGAREITHMRMPGVEPGSQAWEACMIPLHYMRSAFHCAKMFTNPPNPNVEIANGIGPARAPHHHFQGSIMKAHPLASCQLSACGQARLKTGTPLSNAGAEDTSAHPAIGPYARTRWGWTLHAHNHARPTRWREASRSHATDIRRLVVQPPASRDKTRTFDHCLVSSGSTSACAPRAQG